MRHYVDSIKSCNYRQLAIDHAEKAVFAVGVLLVLVGLSDTCWSRYDRQPEEFAARVELEVANLRASDWPQAIRDRYESIPDIGEAVAELITPLDIAKFEYEVEYITPLYKPPERIREPRWLAVTELRGVPSAVILRYRPEAPLPDKADSRKPAIERNSRDASAPRPADPTEPPIGGGSRLGGGSATVFTPDETEDGALGESAGDVTSGVDDGPDGATGSPDDPEDEGGNEFAGGELASSNAEGRRFIAVVGLVPFEEQLAEVSRSLNVSSLKSGELLQYIDFELQRITAVSGPDPWAGGWVPVDMRLALDILETVDGFDTEVISSALTDSVITMPLPRRVAGVWDHWAGHPRLALLSNEQRKIEMMINAKALEIARDQLEQRRTVPKRGFASKQHDIRRTRSRLGPRMTDIRRSVMEKAKGMDSGAHALIAGKVLLFRYLDFAVEPGNAYRYRVRLVVRNPNYRRSITALVNPDVALGETRETPWSNVTDPVVVPSAIQLFLTKVLPGSSLRPRPSARISVFDWYTKAGTHVLGELKRVVVGQFVAAFTQKDSLGRISGGIKTTVLRPADYSLRKEPHIGLVTKIVLVDVDEQLHVTERNHREVGRDLKHNRDSLMADRAIVIDRYGRLVTLDNESQQSRLVQAQKALDNERQPWLRYVTTTPDTPAQRSPLEALTKDDDTPDDEMTGGRRTLRRGRNPLLRGRQ